jgi:1-acyl-sn-glycerol-3-phosphate acyltransferase
MGMTSVEHSAVEDRHGREWRKVPWLLRRPCEYVLYVGLVLLFVVGAIVYLPVSLVLKAVLPRRSSAGIGRRILSLLFRFWCWAGQTSGLIHWDLDELEEIAEEGRIILLANHPSQIDALLLVSRLPLSACVMKASLARNPLLGVGASLAGYLQNRSSSGLVKEGVKVLSRGGQILVFPEGTRSRQGALGEFKSGFALIAARADCMVQTLSISMAPIVLGKGTSVLRAPCFPLEVRVRLGHRFPPPSRDGIRAYVESVRAYYLEAREFVERGETSLAPPPEGGR